MSEPITCDNGCCVYEDGIWWGESNDFDGRSYCPSTGQPLHSDGTKGPRYEVLDGAFAIAIRHATGDGYWGTAEAARKDFLEQAEAELGKEGEEDHVTT